MDEFKALNPDKDKVSNKLLLYCEYAIGSIVGLCLLLAAVAMPFSWVGVIPVNAVYIIASILVFWIIKREMEIRSGLKSLKYVFDDAKIEPVPGNCVPGVPGKRPILKEVTRVDLVRYSNKVRNLGQIIDYKKNLYYLIRWSSVIVPEKGAVVLHTSQKAPAGIGTNSYVFSPEDVDGFIAAVKKRAGNGVEFRTIDI